MNDDLLTSDIDASSDLVTVATFDDSVAASVAMNRLKHAGLPAVLSRENAVTWFWYLSSAIGGIGVQVNSRDAEAARSFVVLVGFYLGGGLELPMAWFEHQASRLIRFVDEKSGEDRKGVGGYGLDGTSLTFFVVRGNTCVADGTFQLSGCSATAPVGMTPSPRTPVLFRPHENNFPSLVRAYL